MYLFAEVVFTAIYEPQFMMVVFYLNEKPHLQTKPLPQMQMKMYIVCNAIRDRIDGVCLPLSGQKSSSLYAAISAICFD